MTHTISRFPVRIKGDKTEKIAGRLCSIYFLPVLILLPVSSLNLCLNLNPIYAFASHLSRDKLDKGKGAKNLVWADCVRHHNLHITQLIIYIFLNYVYNKVKKINSSLFFVSLN